jgi:hypothetical protein
MPGDFVAPTRPGSILITQPTAAADITWLVLKIVAGVLVEEWTKGKKETGGKLTDWSKSSVSGGKSVASAGNTGQLYGAWGASPHPSGALPVMSGKSGWLGPSSEFPAFPARR